MLPEIFEVDRKTGLPVDRKIKWNPSRKIKKVTQTRGTQKNQSKTPRRSCPRTSSRSIPGSPIRTRETEEEIEICVEVIHQKLEENRRRKQFEKELRERELEVNDHFALTHYGVDDGRRSLLDPCYPGSKNHDHCVRLTPEDTVVTYFEKLQAQRAQTALAQKA